MNRGEILTRATIWITIIAYAAGAATFALSHRRDKWDSTARLLWTLACVALLAHVASAFSFYHGWSHDVAYRDTARQTDEIAGINWGGGLYVNYALLILWIVDVLWWWSRGHEGYRNRPWMISVAWHGFLIFIVFNATVIFATGVARWAGLLICLSLCGVWLFALRRSRFATAFNSPI
jgi:hypothetical protein